MRVLAVDTATFMGSVAVLDGGTLLAETSALVRAAHGETLLPHVHRTLEMARVSLRELDLLAVGLGPGSFTGVRIGVATIKGLALAEGTPIVGVGSLQVIAAGMLGTASLRIPVLDAFKGEVYAAAYRRSSQGCFEESVAPLHAEPAQAAARLHEGVGPDAGPAALAGSGLVRYPGELERALGLTCERAPAICDVPRASVLALEAQGAFEARGPDDLAALEPLYVRPSDAKLPATPLRSR